MRTLTLTRGPPYTGEQLDFSIGMVQHAPAIGMLIETHARSVIGLSGAGSCVTRKAVMLNLRSMEARSEHEHIGHV